MSTAQESRTSSPVRPVPSGPLAPDGIASSPPAAALLQRVATPELVEQLAEALYRSLDPRFVDCEWQWATEETREWARRRAQRFLPVLIEHSALLAQQMLASYQQGAPHADR